MTVVRGEEDLDLRESAYLAYDRQDYGKALEIFNEMESLTEADYFFRGISLLEIGNNDGALNDFSKLISTQNKDYAYPSKWFSALLYLKLEDESSAKPILELLRDSDSEYSSNANEILEKL